MRFGVGDNVKSAASATAALQRSFRNNQPVTIVIDMCETIVELCLEYYKGNQKIVCMFRLKNRGYQIRLCPLPNTRKRPVPAASRRFGRNKLSRGP